MSILHPMREAETLLARAVQRLLPPKHTEYVMECMERGCRRIYSRQLLPYDPDLGREFVSHGLCRDCAALRGVFDD